MGSLIAMFLGLTILNVIFRYWYSLFSHRKRESFHCNNGTNSFLLT